MASERICLYFRQEPERDRWFPGDRHVRPFIRRLARGKPRPGGVEKVFINLCLGLDRQRIPYEVNVPFTRLRDGDQIAVLGRGRHSLEGYERTYPVVAGIGLMTHPAEWPLLCEEYPVARYLQHSAWTNEIYRPYFGNRCTVWPAGIDTSAWLPGLIQSKTIDFLIYDKILWNYERTRSELLEPVRAALRRRGLKFREIRCGAYAPADYREALSRSRAMIFLAEHESQGLACQECLASGVPVLAWDQGRWLDPNRYRWGTPDVAATSVPYWDERCGIKFRGAVDFPDKLQEFLDGLRSQRFAPRDYIMENLTLERSARLFVDILSTVKHP